MVSLIYLGKENPISYKTVFGMDGFDRHDTDGGNQTADSASDIKVYPESASGCLINDLGKLLNMNPDFYRRRIRRIRPAAIAVGLSAICLIAIFLIPSESNPVFQNFFSALFGFFLGLASSAYEKFRKWAERVNQTMKDAEGSMPIWEAIYKNWLCWTKVDLKSNELKNPAHQLKQDRWAGFCGATSGRGPR